MSSTLSVSFIARLNFLSYFLQETCFFNLLEATNPKGKTKRHAEDDEEKEGNASSFKLDDLGRMIIVEEEDDEVLKSRKRSRSALEEASSETNKKKSAPRSEPPSKKQKGGTQQQQQQQQQQKVSNSLWCFVWCITCFIIHDEGQTKG